MSAHDTNLDLDHMDLAIRLAQNAAEDKEVPVGALIWHPDLGVIATGANRKEANQCAIHHAEIIAIEGACKKLNSWRLSDCTLISTLEPCFMCSGAIIQARIRRVVFGAYDEKFGALGSLFSLHLDSRTNHRFEVKSGVQGEKCAQLLKDFFRERRGLKR